MKNRRMAFAGVTVAAAAALSASLSGCGTADAGVSAVRADTTIEMITAAQNSSFYLSMECGAAVEARKQGVNITVAGPQQDTASAQLPLVQGVIVGNPDALIISPAAGASASLTAAEAGSGSSLTQALYVAEENDTKVVFADSSVADGNIGASRVTSDNSDGGRVAADNLGRLLGGKGKVALISAPGGGSQDAARIAAFRSEMAARYPGITVFATQAGAVDSPSAAASFVTSNLKAHPDLAAVLALTQNATQGAITALAQAHETGKVKLATFEAGPFQMTGLTIRDHPAHGGPGAGRGGRGCGGPGDQRGRRQEGRALRQHADGRDHAAEHEQLGDQALHLRRHLHLVTARVHDVRRLTAELEAA